MSISPTRSLSLKFFIRNFCSSWCVLHVTFILLCSTQCKMKWYIRTSDKMNKCNYGKQSPPTQISMTLHDAGKTCKLNSGNLPALSNSKLHPLLYLVRQPIKWKLQREIFSVMFVCIRWWLSSGNYDTKRICFRGEISPLCCCCSWSGPAAKAPDALQPWGLLYTLFSRSSHCRRQLSPRPTRRERSKQREVELNGRERVAENFA
jgi:hypothetical protein